MNGEHTGKRRSRRIEPDGCYLRLLVKVPVLMRDVGLDGAQLESKASVPAESDAHLRTMLRGRSFESDVNVTWSGEDPDDATRRLGVNFRSMDEQSRTALSDFLVTAPEDDK